MDVRSIVELVKQTPEIQRAVDAIEAQLARTPVMPEDLDEMIQMLEAVVQDPSRYPEMLAAAIQDGMIDPNEAPQEYDPTFVLAVLIALYEYRDRLGKQGYARGGLRVAGRKLQAAGRGGDSILAHINPREAEMLRRMGGNGTINPNTGLREYKSGKKILGAVLPIALSFIAPGLGTAIGTALGASGAAATALGGAIIGGVSSGISGGNVLQGMAFGALGGGFGGQAGGAINDALGLGLSQGAQNVLGGALVGGVTGAATGQGFGKGALMGAAGQAVGNLAGGNTFGGALGEGVSSAGRTFGNMLAAGYDPKTAVLGGGLAGLASGLMYEPKPTALGSGLKPSDAVVDGLKAPAGQDASFSSTGTTNFLTGEQGVIPGQAPTLAGNVPTTGLQATPGMLDVNLPAIQGPAAAAPAPASSSPFSLKNLGTLALVSQLAASRPPDVQEAISALSPQQQEYFDRPSVQWDWQKLQNDANAQNMSLSQFMAAYWPQVTSGAYNTTPAANQPGGMAMGGVYARGGAGPLGAVARLARGAGTGRDDTINARLSDGEYVMDAETVAMLGDGSTDAGAKRLDDMRAALRKHKGRTLAKGKFSPNAKSPLAYLKGAA